jgi:predicted LPLAT superfamily acyltransferase
MNRAPLAITSEGTVLLNAALFDDVTSMDEVVALAREQPGAVFIGIVVSADEMKRLQHLLDDAHLQAAYTIIGKRQRAMRK